MRSENAEKKTDFTFLGSGVSGKHDGTAGAVSMTLRQPHSPAVTSGECAWNIWLAQEPLQHLKYTLSGRATVAPVPKC